MYELKANHALYRPMKMDEVMPEIKKQKIEVKDEVDAAADATLEKLMADQSIELFKIHDKLKASLKKQELIEILEKNKQEVPVGTSEVKTTIFFYLNVLNLICSIAIDT